MTQKFFNKVRSFMKELGFSDIDFEKFKKTSCDFAEFLSSCGAKRILYRQNLRSIEGVGHSGLLITGGMSVITTTLPCGDKAVLIQNREMDEIGLPGGGTELWQYKNTTVAEPFILTAYREFKEEVGEDLHFELEFFEEHTSTIVYPNGDITYSPCTFYRADVPYAVACRYATGRSDEGKMALVKISDLHQYQIFSNHLAAFEKLEAEL